MSQPAPTDQKRILCIDGGGFRGLGCLYVLDAICKKATQIANYSGTGGLRPCQIFDLISGSGTGGLLAILLGTLSLDCATAIDEYKKLGKSLFGGDRDAFVTIVNGKAPTIDPQNYEAALEQLVSKYGQPPDKDLPFSPQSRPTGDAQTAVLLSSGIKNLMAGSWDKASALMDPNAPVREVARWTVAAPIYKIKTEPGTLFKDAANHGDVNPTVLAANQAAKTLWPQAKLGAIVNLGQGLKDDVPAKKPSKPDVYTKEILNLTKRSESAYQDVLKNNFKKQLEDCYHRIDPPLGIGEWELVDIFSSAVEANVKKWLADQTGEIDKIAGKLVKLVEPEILPPPKNPNNKKPPPPPEGTHDPNPLCTLPRPETLFHYLQYYNIIFIIDDSTSMTYYGPRWEEAREALLPIAQFAYEQGADTIEMRFLNSPQICKALKSAASVVQTFDRVKPNPLPLYHNIQRTYTGACLQRVLNEALGQLDAAIGNPAVYKAIKPFSIVLLTDGDADDDPKSVIEAAWARLQANKHHPNYVSIQIVQIGDDPNARVRLPALMHGNIGSMVDTVPYNGVVTPEKLQRILLGAVQPSVRALS
ncbi:hypothetical protein BOTBODRAFT_460182 [Botryobasidium botryosum FD-172 SS1]|uniref:PNPLA domain-containing protein n=1 Tax=Botryobasidium botryosum (strain FD-172 SS1) TaxID=930990 RepID=A0A067M902_BOTB1|nr:hypothetical protein BOTBODRAFT_460182 [Botryobasidium botryosum FD-172 SS1]